MSKHVKTCLNLSEELDEVVELVLQSGASVNMTDVNRNTIAFDTDRLVSMTTLLQYSVSTCTK